ncbi:hypothetical protein PsorP6_003960 [Peronosclerospora sorghi]|uniref:Uncharacterized protein n=1 Tax=Peronosclerospora sorghi TaxID=230839 RepID=A0ACC0VKI1_9STRA|nr:hypothetical protein PsorP6_003960 [Peronosclerospora sorghi]
MVWLKESSKIISIAMLFISVRRAFSSEETRPTHAPTMTDWNLAKNIAKYLKGTRILKITMKKPKDASGGFKIKVYSDAYYGGEDRKSTTGRLVVDKMLVSWIFKKKVGSCCRPWM